MTSDLKKLWAIFTPTERRRTAWILIAVILMALAETAGVISIMPFLSVLSRPSIIDDNAWLRAVYQASGLDDVRSFTIALGLASIVIVVVSSICKVVTQHVLNRFVHFLRHSISARLLGRYLNQPYAFFLVRNSSDLSKNILSETDQLLFQLVQPLTQMIAQGAVILAMGILIVLYDPSMAIGILVVVGLLYGTIYGAVRQRLARIGAARVAANRERYQACNEALGGIKDVKITHSTGAYTQRFNHASREYSRHLAANDTLSQTPLYMVEAVGYSGLILIALFLLLRSGDLAHVLPAIGLYGFAAYRMLPAAQIVYRGFAKLRFSSSTLDGIHRDLSLPEALDTAPRGMLAPKREIRLEGICFAYSSAPDKPVLDGFNLVIPANSTVGIVGESGAGKSTVMDLLLGLLQPQAGTLRVDDKPVTAAHITEWQRAIGYVPQHIFLSDSSVAENIAFGVPKHEISIRDVERAATEAQIHDFITTDLAQGYDTFIGERGIRLSGGQRQRIGIARALYRDPPILLLDEATSALDPITEAGVIGALTESKSKRTIISIAHSLTSLNGFDQIVVVEAPLSQQSIE